ncbi:MAG: NB-ARC domain-containing protein [Chloroflexota bacterium]|nr:NB-ARC domain-containing protein [Chloroflexota bacterium]
MSSSIYAFISSKMQELAPERRALRDLLPTLGQGVVDLRAWIFEDDAPASNQSIREVYLKALSSASLYIGLFWNDFGQYTLDEFEQAARRGIDRHIYVKDVDADKRDPRLVQFLSDISGVTSGVTPKWFKTTDELRAAVKQSVEAWIKARIVPRPGAQYAILAADADDLLDLPSTLIGRGGLVARVRKLLDGGERVLLNGFGGIGKTSLAASVAADWLDEEKGDVLWLRVGSEDAETIMERLAAALDDQQAVASASGEAKTRALRDLIKASSAKLLVIDDAWNGAALNALVAALPRKLPLLVTSRQRFNLSRIIDLDELTPDDALQALGYYAGDRDFRKDADAKALCRQLGSIPYALEIAGGRLKIDNLTPAQLRKQIASAPHDIAMPPDFADEGRESFKDLLDSSLNALDPPTRAVFLATGAMFAPTFTVGLLALVLNQPDEAVEVALAELHRRSLVRRTKDEEGVSRDVYRVYDLAYSYARTRFLSAGGDESAVIAAARRYIERHIDSVDVLDDELPNLLGAAARAAETGADEALIDLMRRLAQPGGLFEARGYSQKALDLLKSAINAARTRKNWSAAHYLSSSLGNAYRQYFRQYDLAFAAYEDALEWAGKMGDSNREARILSALGTTRFRQGAADADEFYEKATALAEARSDDDALAVVLNHRSFYEGQKLPPDFERARRFSDQAVQLAIRLTLHEFHFSSLLNRASAERELGQLQTALATDREAYQLADNHKNHLWMADAQWAIGEDQHALNDRTEAQRAFDESLTLWHKCGMIDSANELRAMMQELGYKNSYEGKVLSDE